jgi:hypothetical protein
MPLPASTILTGLNRVLSSAKVHTAAATCAGMWVAAHYASQAIEPSQRAWLWISFLGACVVVVREVIAGWAAEDAAKASVPVSAAPSPTVQVNTGATASNEQTTAAGALPATPVIAVALATPSPTQPAPAIAPVPSVAALELPPIHPAQ